MFSSFVTEILTFIYLYKDYMKGNMPLIVYNLTNLLQVISNNSINL